MKSTPGFEQFREKGWRRPLTAAEEAQVQSWLEAHPEARADWQAETALNEALSRLPDAPVPSNFTARVLGAVERDAAAGGRTESHGWSLFHWPVRWLPRTAAAALVVGLGLLLYQHELTSKRAARAESLVTLTELPGMASPDILENFDAIHAMSQTASADEDLIQLLP